MDATVIDLDPIRKEEIAEALKVIIRSTKELKLLQEYNFNGLYDSAGKGPGLSGHIPAKCRLMDIAYELTQASSKILRCAADLSDD